MDIIALFIGTQNRSKQITGTLRKGRRLRGSRPPPAQKSIHVSSLSNLDEGTRQFRKSGNPLPKSYPLFQRGVSRGYGLGQKGKASGGCRVEARLIL